ncbi:YbaY family lipoprotein [Halomonas sp. LR3S48]|uniref:YbaY family lipoprotein n=1 Tax=Halomonas sp. LR3S48 TaxID=2982694 RepID=UPI0021E3DBDE|nr:YbaY family lipoprotein [Halomonas sp. LR3S48]UYG04145.1 YbaY family lipoprotein [Halomonas sp. LR3S48]
MSSSRTAMQTFPGRWLLGALALVVLAGCAGTPDFAELNVRVTPPGGLEVSEDAELRVQLRDAGGTLAETRATPSGSGPWPIALRFDRRTLEAAHSPQLSAELRQQGNLTHVTAEPVAISGSGGEPVSLPLDPRP